MNIYAMLANGFTSDVGGFDALWGLLTRHFSDDEKVLLFRKLGLIHGSMLKRTQDKAK